MAGCTFCSIVEGSSPSQTIYEDDNAQAFMDLLPMTPGHCLIVPKKHVVDVWDLDDDDAAHVMQACTSGTSSKWTPTGGCRREGSRTGLPACMV